MESDYSLKLGGMWSSWVMIGVYIIATWLMHGI